MDEIQRPALSLKTRAGDFCLYVIARLFVSIVQVLPLDMADSLCWKAAKFFTRVVVIRKKTFAENMRLIFPDSTTKQQQALCEAMWHHLLLMICEIAWAPRRLHLSNWRQYFCLYNNREMLQYLLSGRPVIMVTGHFGNFEICGYMIGLMGFPTVTIARRLDNEFLHRYLADFRGTHGQYMVDKEGCAPVIDRHLANNGILSLLADQHAGDKGCWVDFLGADASCHKALALFSLASGAPMMVGYTRRGSKPMEFHCGTAGIADPRHDSAGICSGVRQLTQWYSDRLADVIKPAVEQYWWVHRRWRPKPSRVRSESRAA